MESATDCLFWKILWELDLPHLSKWSKVHVNTVLNADLERDTQRMSCVRQPIVNVCLFVYWLLFYLLFPISHNSPVGFLSDTNVLSYMLLLELSSTATLLQPQPVSM